MTPAIAAQEPMRCLSVQQPFAWLICMGVKTAENRTWATAYRGPVAIHAGAATKMVAKLIRESGAGTLKANPFVYGAIIGIADLHDIVEMGPALEDNPSADGPICWLFREARLLPTPIPSRGKLKLYSLTPDESEKVRRQLPGLDPPPACAEARQWAAALYGDPVDVTRISDLASGLNASCGEGFVNQTSDDLVGRNDAQRAIPDCDLDPTWTHTYVIGASGWRLPGNDTR